MRTYINLIVLSLIGAQIIQANNLTHNYYLDKSIEYSVSLITLAEEQTDVLHIFTHGQPGLLLIEDEWLSAKEIRNFILEHYDISQITAIHFYGCNFGQGSIGQLAVNYLETQFDLPISASNNVTGKDGDWNLEVGRYRKNSNITYPSNLQSCQADHYKAFAVHSSSDRIFGWSDLSLSYELIGEVFSDINQPLNHLAMDYDRCRLLVGGTNIRGSHLNSLYYYSLQSSNRGVLKKSYLAELGTSTAGAVYSNHTLYFYDDEGPTAGLYVINFDPSNLSDTATPLAPPLKIMDVGGSGQPSGLGDIALDENNNYLYVLGSFTPSSTTDNGKLFRLNLSNLSSGWEFLGALKVDEGEIGSQLFIDDQGRLLTSNIGTGKWVHINPTDASIISEFGNASTYDWSDFSRSNYNRRKTFLSIQLDQFTGKVNHSVIELEWETFSEINNKEFILQVSIDGIHFTDLARIQGQGNIQSKTKYDYKHYNPPMVKQLYYRLLPIDNDGSGSYSRTITVDLNEKTTNQIKVYPTVLHSSQTLTIETTANQLQKFKLYNQLGAEIPLRANEMYTSGRRQDLSLHHLPLGLYFLIFEDGSVHRFFIQ